MGESVVGCLHQLFDTVVDGDWVASIRGGAVNQLAIIISTHRPQCAVLTSNTPYDHLPRKSPPPRSADCPIRPPPVPGWFYSW